MRRLAAAAAALLFAGSAFPAAAQSIAFRQALAEGVALDDGVAAFYREANYEDLWTGEDDAARRAALLEALEMAHVHALPTGRYDPDTLRAAFAAADTPWQRGEAEALAAMMFVRYADDVQSGILNPGRVSDLIHTELPRVPRDAQLAAFAEADPRAYIRGLPPAHPHYRRLLRERIRLIEAIADGTWGGRIAADRLDPGTSGPAVVQLRNRLIAMGYLDRSATAEYDQAVAAAVQEFQADHGLETDGVAGPSTIEALNVGPEERLREVLVAIERQRWINHDLGQRHVLVNIAAFHAYVVDDYEITFETRTVVGATDPDRATPEFSDVMEHMVVNPTWYVPRSIAVGEYLPQLRRNPYAVGHLNVVDQNGQIVPRGAVNFSRYNASTFPFSLRQPPSDTNALGLVKFMFPNQWNIYLHDTPARHLFSREVRAYSHGCIRVHRPFELAYHLLAPQSADPRGEFDRALNSGFETYIYLDDPVPVHLVYWTAWIDPDGGVNYRDDVYGRNGRIWDALSAAGVSLPSTATAAATLTAIAG